MHHGLQRVFEAFPLFFRVDAEYFEELVIESTTQTQNQSSVGNEVQCCCFFCESDGLSDG